MKRYALGWACNLNDIFVRFPYEKCKSLIANYKTKQQQRAKVKQVFRAGIQAVLNDIIENNVTFKLPGLGYYKGEIHMEPVKGSEFERLREKGKFKNIDFLETIFTAYQMYLYLQGKHDGVSARRKFPIYMSKFYRDKLAEYTNQGKTYC